MSKHIVVIDDCRVTLAVVEDLLETAGYSVSTAENSVYSNHIIYGSPPPDLILLDVMMPLMSGEKKARLLKEREKSRNIPVLLISSKNEEELRELAVSSGADGYITKPFTMDKLVCSIKNHLAT
ncbi:MAG TPA: response regulator [Geobacteraceae bacterium]